MKNRVKHEQKLNKTFFARKHFFKKIIFMLPLFKFFSFNIVSVIVILLLKSDIAVDKNHIYLLKIYKCWFQ